MELGYLTAEEISSCRSAIKRDTASGPDKAVTMEVVRALDLPVLELIFNTWLALGQVPAAFKEAHTIVLLKSGDTNDPNYRRPITICSIVSRLYAKGWRHACPSVPSSLSAEILCAL